jgi:hypothetical protein
VSVADGGHRALAQVEATQVQAAEVQPVLVATAASSATARRSVEVPALLRRR